MAGRHFLFQEDLHAYHCDRAHLHRSQWLCGRWLLRPSRSSVGLPKLDAQQLGLVMLLMLRYLPAAAFIIVALFFLLMTRAGDNVDARALSGFFFIPAIFFATLGALALAIAYFLR